MPFKFTGKIAKVTIDLQEMKTATANEVEKSRRRGLEERAVGLTRRRESQGAPGREEVHLDLNSGSVRGGTMDVGMVELNWYWDRYVRWQFNYGYAMVTEGLSPGNLQIFQARLQMMC